MIGKLIGALVGKRASRHISGVDETGGALLGAAAVPVLRKVGTLGVIALAVGGYALKRHHDKSSVATPSRKGAAPA